MSFIYVEIIAVIDPVSSGRISVTENNWRIMK